MSVYAERRKGKLTGQWVVEVVRMGHRTRIKYPSYEVARVANSQLMAGYSPTTVAKSNGRQTLGWLLGQAGTIWEGCKTHQQARRLEVCVSLLGDSLPLDQVTTEALDQLKRDLMNMKPTDRRFRPVRDPKTLHRYLSAISHALRWAHKRGHLVAMPSIPWLKTTEAPKRHFSIEDERAVCAKLIEYGHLDHALVVRILSQTGLRVGELLRLKPEMVTNGFILVGDWTGGTKTGDSRTVPISAPLEAALRDLLTRGLPTYRSLLRCLKEACKRAGVDERKTLHKLRHTAATRLAKAGVHAFTMQRYLGHRNIKTTLGYTSIESEDLVKASEALRVVGDIEGNRAIEEAVLCQTPERQALGKPEKSWRPRPESNRGARICRRSYVADISAPSLRNEGDSAELPVDNSWIELAEGP